MVSVDPAYTIFDTYWSESLLKSSLILSYCDWSILTLFNFSDYNILSVDTLTVSVSYTIYLTVSCQMSDLKIMREECRSARSYISSYDPKDQQWSIWSMHAVCYICYLQ